MLNNSNIKLYLQSYNYNGRLNLWNFCIVCLYSFVVDLVSHLKYFIRQRGDMSKQNDIDEAVQ